MEMHIEKLYKARKKPDNGTTNSLSQKNEHNQK